jgi:hypothetical protein
MFGFSAFAETPFASLSSTLYIRTLTVIVTTTNSILKQINKLLSILSTSTISLLKIINKVLSVLSSVQVSFKRTVNKLFNITSNVVVSLNRQLSLLRTLLATNITISVLIPNRIYFTELLSKIYIYAEDRVRNLMIKKSRSITIDKSN